MKTYFSAMAIACALVIAGCDDNPYSDEADAIRDSADHQAEQVQESGQQQADIIRDQADRDAEMLRERDQSGLFETSPSEIKADLREDRAEAKAEKVEAVTEAEAEKIEAQGEAEAELLEERGERIEDREDRL